MDWTMYIVIGLCVLTIGSLIMNYFNYVEINNLRSKALNNSNRIDYLDARSIQDCYKTDCSIRSLRNGITGIQDTLKYSYLNRNETYAMWDIHNARVNSYYDDFTREVANINRLLPLIPLADKFEIKRKLKCNKQHADELKYDLKEIDNELKGIA